MAIFSLLACPAERTSWGGVTIAVTRTVARRQLDVPNLKDATSAFEAFKAECEATGQPLSVSGYFHKSQQPRGSRLPAGCGKARFESFVNLADEA